MLASLQQSCKAGETRARGLCERTFGAFQPTLEFVATLLGLGRRLERPPYSIEHVNSGASECCGIVVLPKSDSSIS